MSHGDRVVDRAGGIQGDRLERQRADRRHGRREPAFLRPAVASGSHAHRAGRRDAAPLRARDCGLRGRLGDGQHHRGQRGADPRAGRRRQGDAGAVRRRGFVGAGGAAASCDRRAADLRVRRSRTAAAGRRRSGDGDVRGAHGRARDSRRCRAALPRSPAGVADPEAKRKIIGRVFVEVFERKRPSSRT